MNSTFTSTRPEASGLAAWASSPLLVEAALAVSKIIVIVTALLVTGLSIFTGASIEVALLRAALSVIVIGLLLWMFNWRLSTAVLENLAAELKEQNAQPLSTIERQA